MHLISGADLTEQRGVVTRPSAGNFPINVWNKFDQCRREETHIFSGTIKAAVQESEGGAILLGSVFKGNGELISATERGIGCSFCTTTARTQR